jgi:alpha-1,6-rhamnosyltransferase
VLVCWNHAAFVRHAVESVAKQSRRPQQILVFDNGSTDGSREILRELERELGVTVIFQENVGLVRTLNRGLAIATGEFFAMLATDDAWQRDKTALQAAFLEQHTDVHMVSGQVHIVDEQGEPMSFPNEGRPGRVTFADLMTRGNSVFGPTVMCRTATLRELGGYDEALRIEDYSLALRFASRGLGIHVLSEIVADYRRHGSNWTNRPLTGELAEIGHRYRDRPEYRAYVRHHFPRHFRALVESGERRAALRWLAREPIEWSWPNLGVGSVKFVVPRCVIGVLKKMLGRGRAAAVHTPEGHPPGASRLG